MDIEECETLKTHLLNLRYEIEHMVIASDPRNLNLVQRLAADRGQWLREVNRVTNRRKNQSNSTTPVSKRNATDPRSRTFTQSSNQPSGDRMKINVPSVNESDTQPKSAALEKKFSIRQPRKGPKPNNEESGENVPRVNCTTT